MSPVSGKAIEPGDLPRKQNISGKSPVFRFILLIEAALIFSIISAYLIITITKDPKKTPGVIATPTDYHNLFKNYEILTHFMKLPIQTDTIQDPDFEIGNPFVIDFLKLKTAETDLGEKGEKKAAEVIEQIKNLEEKHNNIPHRYQFLLHKKNKFLLKYLSLVKNDAEIIAQYTNDPESFDSLETKISLINSFVKAKQTEKGFQLFKELFQTNRIKHFEEKISRQTLNTFLRQLDYDYWLLKFKYLVDNNQYSEYVRVRQYVKSPQLITLFNGEFNYRQKQYDQSRKSLTPVKDEKLIPFKERILFKINLREKNYNPADALEQLDPVKADAALYQEVLLDSASILLTDGETRLSEKFFSQYINFTNLILYGHWIRLNLLTGEPIPHRGSDYWRVLWINAWLNYQNNNKPAAIKYLHEGLNSPIFSYRVANRYWLQKWDNSIGNELKIEKYPFTYYYAVNQNSLENSPQESLKPFIDLLNHNQSQYFNQVITDLNDLVHFNFLDEAVEFIRWILAKTSKNLTVSDKHTLMLIQSIIYLRKQNYAMAFISFRDNFECYQCIRLPRFLSAIVLPVKYASLIEEYSEMHNVDPELIMALIREESFFRPDVVSPAKACGLMQLMLQTARQVAYSHRIRIYRNDLFDPKTNLQLGIEYLKYLLDKYKGKIHLALAAYNAGDFRVDDWLKRFGKATDDEFIEMIPFTETRNYVKNIIRNYYYYRFYYGTSNQ